MLFEDVRWVAEEVIEMPDVTAAGGLTVMYEAEDVSLMKEEGMRHAYCMRILFLCTSQAA